MKVLIQRVKRAGVTIDRNTISEIEAGLLLLIGIEKDDTPKDIERMAKKVAGLRIFEDELGKMNLNVQQIKGQVLSVSQFTLAADTGKGNRPGFDRAANPEMAIDYWQKFNALLHEMDIEVNEGLFGRHMDVELINDGPVTIWLDSKTR